MLVKSVVANGKLLAALVLTIACNFPAIAHQQKTAFVEVLFNARSERIEVAQRFDLHDSEHATRQLFGEAADIIDSETTQLAFYEYATQHFALYRADGSQIELDSVGYEVEGKFFWVYQVTPMEADLQTLTIASSALRDLWPDQVNWVNVKRDGEVETAIFESASDKIQISLPSLQNQ